MLFVNVITVGKLKEPYLRSAAAEYSKRLQSFCRLKITEVDEEKTADNPQSSQIENTLEKEGSRILKHIGKNAFVISLCIEGKLYSSEELAEKLSAVAIDGISEVDFIIGGSWGLSKSVKNSSDIRLSMSKMTFPHQLARVMLCEQIYRAFQINNGGKYHK